MPYAIRNICQQVSSICPVLAKSGVLQRKSSEITNAQLLDNEK